ncbi:hypothetical protein [Nocardioides sp. B-3]|uniref:hypothetical protein n=1 Tax=Nocardioides sp. B-3 TaxID=2895565 RepID=UPI0021530093|nr:hypothetical protein [Nocardioides sp. B-3]UUZ61142.1 hypothetical protein LP418_11265 [Nocardioides sp. B-3]
MLGFGAVLSVDWVGLLWVVRRRTLSDVLDTAGHLTAPIWLGLAGLVLTGILLEPALDNPLTQVKLGPVLLIVWNGLFAGLLHHRLCVGASFDTAPRRVLLAAAAATTVSRVGWWGSMVIGFINH